jgi:hypothetical protein
MHSCILSVPGICDEGGSPGVNVDVDVTSSSDNPNDAFDSDGWTPDNDDVCNSFNSFWGPRNYTIWMAEKIFYGYSLMDIKNWIKYASLLFFILQYINNVLITF